MQERYRVRSGYIVQLTDEQIGDLLRDRSTLVEIDGKDVEFYVDGTDRLYDGDSDEFLVLGFDGIERLSSGFPARFYSVLGGQDLVLLADSRHEAEAEMIRRAGGVIDPDPEDFPVEPRNVDGDVDVEEKATAEESGSGLLFG